MKLVDCLKDLDVDFESPFYLTIEGKTHKIQLLVRGFGAKNGIIVDASWGIIEPISVWLTEHEYGFSCFNPDKSCSLRDAQELLNDWGMYKA